MTTVILRSLLGLIFFVFGLNGFLRFIPLPPPPPPAAEFFFAMAKTGYFLPLLSGSQVVGGFLLLSGLLVPVGLLILAPIVVHILAFHVFLAPGGLPLAIIVAVLELIVAWQYGDAFAPIFASQAQSQGAGSEMRARA